MQCIRCEVLRAKIKAHVLDIFGWNSERIAKYLADHYEADYFLIANSIYRTATVPPYKPYLIYESHTKLLLPQALLVGLCFIIYMMISSALIVFAYSKDYIE